MKQQKNVLGFEILCFKLAFILVYRTYLAVLVTEIWKGYNNINNQLDVTITIY